MIAMVTDEMVKYASELCMLHMYLAEISQIVYDEDEDDVTGRIKEVLNEYNSKYQRKYVFDKSVCKIDKETIDSREE